MAHHHDHQTSNPSEQTHYWRVDHFFGLEMLRATYITHRFAKHIHVEFAIGVIERGAEEFYYRRRDHVASQGSICLVNPGEIHTGKAATESGWTYRMFYPSMDMLQTIAEAVSDRAWEMPHFSKPVIYDPLVASKLLNLHRLLEHDTSLLTQQSALYDTFGTLLIRHGANRPAALQLYAERDAVKLVCEYLQAHLGDNTTLEELAALVGFSPYHFLRIFRKEMGLPPHAYRNHLRIRRAKVLLSNGTPIVETATLLGFTDQSHLTHRFKQAVGVTPAQYAKGVR